MSIIILVCQAVAGTPLAAVLVHRANVAEREARREAMVRHPSNRFNPERRRLNRPRM